LTRRRFLAAGTAAGLALGVGRPAFASDKPALLGGKPTRTQPFPSWPKMDSLEDKALLEVLRSGRWFRGGGQKVSQFEEAFARLTGARWCLATANGTGALVASLGALDVGPGDEVILPPYTFIATVNAVLLHYALPVFVDSDSETFQIDARKIEPAITDRTALILPVHLGGSVADMDTILAIAGRRQLPVVEDACQSHLAEWRGRKVGTLGTTGCFSFQVTKNLCSGEGGAVLTSDEKLLEKCYAFHNNNGPARRKAGYNFSYRGGRAANLRMTEFQGALLTGQMTRLEAQSRTRERNAQYLTALLREVPGVAPARTHEGCTRNAYHLYMFRYDPRHFAGLARDKFLGALAAEGIPASKGYAPLNKEVFLKDVLRSRGYRKIYAQAELDRWEERTRCPDNERLCAEAVWFTQNMLLGERSDMDQIADAVRKIQAHAGALARI
jgi:dTDP-4-amino-4,6-dideoxygalactose transaminase